MEVPPGCPATGGVIPPHDWAAGRPATENLRPVFAIHQIGALAEGLVSPAILW